MSVQELIVEKTLQEIACFGSHCANERRHTDLFVLLTIIGPSFLFRRNSCVTVNYAQKLSHVLYLVESFRRGDRAAGTLNRGRKLDKHQTIKTQVTQPGIDSDFRPLPVCYRRDDSQQPRSFGVCRLLHPATTA